MFTATELVGLLIFSLNRFYIGAKLSTSTRESESTVW